GAAASAMILGHFYLVVLDLPITALRRLTVLLVVGLVLRAAVVAWGLAGPLSLVWFIWKTVEIRSTQSATGILYVQLFLVMSGELLAKYLRVAAGLPLQAVAGAAARVSRRRPAYSAIANRATRSAAAAK